MNHQFNVATLNLFNFVAPPLACHELEKIYTHQQWHQKCDWTQRQIDTLMPDILGFQEIFSPNELERLCIQSGLSNFCVATEQLPNDGHVCQHSTVGLATRFQIISSKAVEPTAEIAAAMGVQAHEIFSRNPLCATLQVPNFGPLRVYVAHLKSGRSKLNECHQVVLSKAQQQLVGNWNANAQRGLEVTALINDVMRQYQHAPLPTVIMGDLNDSLDSALLSSLKQTFDAQRNSVWRMHDAFELAAQHSAADCHLNRSPSFYWGAQGNYLDQILLSAEFHPDCEHNLAHVEQVITHDSHLVNYRPSCDQQCSDHAAIQATIEIRR
ncbi:endonuclease/exonuclease/phosphatase family protein [Echinimonas agarilytica]|uniref:Endonuclease/exonuclease/phosphatase domain-containing protein n=1 Tax=Echinimonas agarilytica TaxID=1215918 RepID=A0AA41W5E1_9GAMM|nr:endonuclease/exonuclease/phosphatase family protein [Echinimonas agarilytica]MCM2678733.1 hypothetical protein [Echinimonas agarilytica]